MELTKEIAQKVKETVECGLVRGKGEPIPGQMCVEAAVCYAYGLPHSDNPPCVGLAVRRFKIGLNDSNWSTNQERGSGMLKLSIAQLNSNVLDQKEFSKKVTIKIINHIIAPLATKYYPEIGHKLRIVTDLSEATTLCRELRSRARADYADYAAIATNAAAAIDYAIAADVAADYAAAAAYYAAKAADVAAADYAACAAADANYDADTNYNAVRDKILIQAADICLDVLKEMKSPGCEYLYLVE